jgi:hypothetical protein
MIRFMRRSADWTLAHRNFRAFRSSLPGLIDEDCVSEYRAILESLKQAGQPGLNDFTIDASELAFRMVQARTGEHIDPRVGVQYSNKKYCDSEHFGSKLERLHGFLNRPDNIRA